VGGLVFNRAAGGYTVGANGGPAITLDNGAAAAAILVSNAGGAASAGSHTVAAPITLLSNLTAAVDNAADTLTLSGGVAGAGKNLTKTGAGTLVLGGSSSYSGVTAVSGGTLVINNSLFGPGGAISIADGATLQAAGSIQRPVTVTGASQSGLLKAVGNLALTNLSGPINFNGHLNTQGNFVQLVTPGDALVRSISMSNGGTLTSGTAIKLANYDGLGSNPGDTGLAFVSGAATVGGTFWAGRTTGDSAVFVGVNGTGDSVTFTGILRGVLNNSGIDVIIQGLDKEGWSPSFASTTGGTFNGANPTVIVLDNPATWTPSLPASGGVTVGASGGGYTQRLIASTTVGTTFTAGFYNAANVLYSWDPASQYTVAVTPHKGDAFDLIRTDGSAWGTASNGKVYSDGTVLNFSGITLPNGFAGGSSGRFSNLPTLPAGLFWHVDATAQHIQLYVGGFLPFGSGVWKNGAGNQTWTTNSADNNNWGTAQPFAAGQIATFDDTVVNFAGGVVTVDAPQTVGGLAFNKSTGGGYSVGGSTLTLANGASPATIQVLLGSHSVSAPLVLASNLSVSVANAADTLTLSGPLSGAAATLTKSGAGTLAIQGNAGHAATVVNAGTLGGTGTLAGPVTVNAGGRLRGDTGAGVGTLAVGATSVLANGGLAATLGAPGASSKLALGGNTLNFQTGALLPLTAVTGFTNLLPAQYTLASLSSGSNLQLDGVAGGVPDGFVYGTYVQGTGASGPVTIDVSALGFPLTPSDTFQLSRSGNALVLNFSSPVPEPTALLALAALAGMAWRRRPAR
jgi:autotransporter-associated beta strand protein